MPELEEHRRYVSDKNRLAAFRRAIERTIRPGDVVLDLGAGTGILGMLACRYGAGRVYAVEASTLAELTRSISNANGLSDRFTVVSKLSTRVGLPEKADVLVCDQVGSFGFNAGLVEYLDDAWQRLLKPGARVIPQQVGLAVAPVELPRAYSKIAFWKQQPADFDFGAMYDLAVNRSHPVNLTEAALLTSKQSLGSIDLRDSQASRVLETDTDVTVERAGTVHGLGCWFVADLVQDISISNAPWLPNAIDREQAFFPLEQPLTVRRGDRLNVRMHVLARRPIVSWSVRLTSTPATALQSSFKGMLVDRSQLARRADDALQLSSWGEAELSVLQLCAEGKNVAQIESEIGRRHADLFSSEALLQRFVGGIVSRCGR